jgi:hypothetical protein
MTSLQRHSGQKVQALLAVQHDRGLLEWQWPMSTGVTDTSATYRYCLAISG